MLEPLSNLTLQASSPQESISVSYDAPFGRAKFPETNSGSYTKNQRDSNELD